jgi:CRISPR/Cas system endoribonuclease Cas6 (RAMP superfamily)
VIEKMERSLKQVAENAKERQYEAMVKKELHKLRMEDVAIHQ